jgi:hypothetical protein
MNWVHAVQKGKAEGPSKIEEIADSMKPQSVEHFMGRGHINKKLPEKVKEASTNNFIVGFCKRAADYGISHEEAVTILHNHI